MQKSNSLHMQGRFLLAFGMFLLALLLYIDRACISVAKDPIANTLGLSNTAMGWVMSIFSLGYAFFQVPSGMLADKIGVRKMLSMIVGIWSVLTALTGAAWNFISLLITRFLFGIGEAGAFPSLSRAIFSWIPLKERGIITGINFSGSRIGAAFALPFVAYLIDSYGWRMSFVILGGIGLVWALIWWFLFRDDPLNHPFLGEKEKDFIATHRQQKEENTSVKPYPFSRLLKKPQMWRLMGQYFCSNFTFFFALTWLFPHLKETYQLESMEAGFYAAAPLIFGAVGNWVSGYLVDFLYKKGRWNPSRILPAAIGFGLAAVGLIGSVFQTEVLGAVIMLSMAIMGADMTLSPSWSVCVDIGKTQAGTVSGTMNMAGNIGAFLTSLAFPYLLEWTGGAEGFFYIGAGLNVLAIWLWMGIRADNPLINDEDE